MPPKNSQSWRSGWTRKRRVEKEHPPALIQGAVPKQKSLKGSEHLLQLAHGQHMLNVCYSSKHKDCHRKYYFSLIFSWVTASLGDSSIKDIENTSPLESRCIELPTKLLFYTLLLSVLVFYLHDSLCPSPPESVSFCLPLSLHTSFCSVVFAALVSHHPLMPMLPFTSILARQFFSSPSQLLLNGGLTFLPPPQSHPPEDVSSQSSALLSVSSCSRGSQCSFST